MSDKDRMGRRSFLSRVVGSAAGFGAVATVAGCASAGPGTPGYTGYTDNDGGPNQDRRGFGRGVMGHTGITDADSGYYQDAAGNGRGTTATRPAPTAPPDQGYRRECTDSDTTSVNGRQDPSGYGRCRFGGGR